MLISFAGHQKVVSKKIYLSGMIYDIKTSKNDVFVKYVYYVRYGMLTSCRTSARIGSGRFTVYY